MLRFNDIVFGPIKSRRLGNSLGINLLPTEGKLCNFDCIYCECGWNKDGRTSAPLPSAEEIAEALSRKLQEFPVGSVDSITFSGHGEPTLHPQFPQIIDIVVKLRDEYCPDAAISVLSNATTLDDEMVVYALKKVDNPILKLDAPTSELAKGINRPQFAYQVEKVIEGMKKFGGNFVLQTMMLSGAEPDYTKNAEALKMWKEIVEELRPRLVTVYSLDRPAPEHGLVKLEAGQMHEMLADMIEKGINIKIY